MDHLRIKVVAEPNSNDEPAAAAARPFIAPPMLFRESAFSRPILPATSSLLLPTPKPAAGPAPNGDSGCVPAPPPDVRYRECLRNHAASLGAHVLDGCGEFMPSGPPAAAEDPLRCAACGCHRSFHRREPEAAAPLLLLPAPPRSRESSSEERNNAGKRQQQQQQKRFRTKFSGEQKGRMAAFAERAGWRMQKKDEAETERFCREIGVSRRVLKVWMHNNKHLNVRSKQPPHGREDQEEDGDGQDQQYYRPQREELGEEERTKTTTTTKKKKK